MKVGHYKNKLLKLNWAEKGREDYSLIETLQVEAAIDAYQETIIDKKNFTLRTQSGLIVPIAISKNAPTGRFKVLEKWENPYWKSSTRFYYPSKTNPIGQYLIIMGNPETNKKIHQGIHKWPDFGSDESKFKKGLISNRGCTRIKPSEMQKIFENINLGSSIIFK